MACHRGAHLATLLDAWFGYLLQLGASGQAQPFKGKDS